MTTASDLATALRALGIDAVSRGSHVLTLGSVLAGAQRMRLDAVHVSVMLDTVAPRPGCTWRPVCCWCADSMDAEVHRINRDTGHDTGCCSFCGRGGEDTLVAAVRDEEFRSYSPRR